MFSAKDVKDLREKTGAGMLDCKKALEALEGNMEKAIDWLREKGIAKASKKESRIAAEGLSEIFVDGNKAVILEVNSETDFVAKNEEFKNFISTVGNAILNSGVTTMDDAMNLKLENGQTISDYLVALIAKIGEKISFRRFEYVLKNDNESFGVYSHLGGRISVLTVLEGANSEVAKDVSMHAAAMRPLYMTRDEVPEEVLEHERGIIKEQAINEGKPAEIAEKMVNGRINKYYKEVCLLEQEFIKDSDKSVEQFVKDNNGTIKKMVRYEVGEGIEKRNDDFASEVMKQVNG
ncbi:MAG: elongation factor Ts [Bacilli bacterium]|nr:elongation factor Ts [Bacilli bacterium]